MPHNGFTAPLESLEIESRSIGRQNTGVAAFASLVQAVQIMALEHEGVVDEPAANAILRAIDSVSLRPHGSDENVWAMIATLDDRVDAALPQDIAGAAALGRTRGETIATALRMEWRDRGALIAEGALELRAVALELARVHTVTVMGVFADRKAAAPSTLAHFLGGLIGPLESTWQRTVSAIDSLNRSPFGAGLLVGEVFGADRERTSDLLGFGGTIENTLDAAGSIEDIVAVLEAIGAQAAVVRRFTTELLTWIRTDPTSFFIDERWESLPEPAHPAHTVSTQLEYVNLFAQRTESEVRTAVDVLRFQPYGPIGINWGPIAESVARVFDHGAEMLLDARAAVREALIVNRAYLANRAGRLYSTASDLATFLMEDQQINPAAARQIAGLSVARLKEANLEAAQITPDIIDAGAVMVIGQELKVEMETLGRYISPRRYIERRDVLGSPKADRTRAWLAGVEERLQQDREEIAARTQHWNIALDSIRARLAESAEAREN